MHHLHFEKLSSTQIYLKDKFNELKNIDQNILVSCDEQTEGIGRNGNQWKSFANAIAMSFTLSPNQTPTLTPIEIGLLTIRFIQKKYNVQLTLKWPNDLLTKDGQKCGGIICQYIDEKNVIAGLGLNIGKIESFTNDFKHGLGNVDQSLEFKDHEVEKLTGELYNFLLANRYNNKISLISDFNKNCYHMNKDVYIFENEKDYLGLFRGIGENGEALVEIDSKIHSFLSSSLTIMD